MPLTTVPAVDLSEVFRQYREPIRGYVRSLVRNPEEAEEITQETFLRAHRKLSGLQDPARISPWLYRIATNISYDRLRRSARQPYVDSLSEPKVAASEPVDREPRLDLLIDQGEMSSCVREYIEALPDTYRAAILLHDVEGLSNPEIARLLGVSLATAKIRVHRARKKLREALGRGCDFSRDERGVFVCERRGQAGDRGAS